MKVPFFVPVVILKSLWVETIVLLQADGSVVSFRETSKSTTPLLATLLTALLFSMSSQSLRKISSELHTGKKNTDVFSPSLSSSSDSEEDDAIERYARQLSGHASSHVKSEPARGWIMGKSWKTRLVIKGGSEGQCWTLKM